MEILTKDRCPIGRWLDEIDHPSKAALTATLTHTCVRGQCDAPEHHRSLPQLRALLLRLGLVAGERTTISQHRNGTCRCSA